MSERALTPGSQLMSIHELSEYLQVPVPTIYDWRTEKKGPPAIKLGKHLRWRRERVDQWLDAQTEVR